MLHNKLLTGHAHAAASNSSGNVYATPLAFITDNEAKRYASDRATGGKTFWFKAEHFIRRMWPQKEEPSEMDAESHKLQNDTLNAIKEVMLTPDVIRGERGSAQEPASSFLSRQSQGKKALSPIMKQWEGTMATCAEIEWSMYMELGNEGVERVIQPGNDSKVYAGEPQIITNMRLSDGSVDNDMSRIPRGRISVVRRVASETEREQLASVALDVMKIFASPEEQIILKKVIAEGLPMRKKLRDELVAVVERTGQMTPGAGGPGAPGAPRNIPDQIIPPGQQPLPAPPMAQAPAAQAGA